MSEFNYEAKKKNLRNNKESRESTLRKKNSKLNKLKNFLSHTDVN